MARIADVMSLRVVSVRPDESVQLSIARMLEESVGSVAVCEGDRLVGIRDVMRTLVERLWREHDPEARETARALLTRGGQQAEVPSSSPEGV